MSRAIETRTAGATSTAIFAFQAFVPILVGIAVYFAAARLLRHRRGGSPAVASAATGR